MAGLPEVTVQGCEEGCRHEWGNEKRLVVSGQSNNASESFHVMGDDNARVIGIDASAGQFCQLCHGWRGCLGLEPTPSAYVAHLVAVFREVKRVLRDDGTLWLNLASSYAGSGATSQKQTNFDIQYAQVGNALKMCQRRVGTAQGFKQKDLVPIPWLVALALQADGWYLRRDCIWAKGRDFDVGDNGYGASMPESCEDRPVSSHEYVFLLTKKARYYYDAVAVRQKWDGGEHHLRSVWLLNTSGYKEAHFATFCERLPETCIRASTSERGVCPECGAQWERVTEHHRRTETDSFCPKHLQGETSGLSNPGWRKKEVPNAYTETTGWRPTCTCPPAEPIPATVLDIFSGAGTTLLVADRLGRDGFGIDQSAEYIKMSYDRLVEDGPMFANVEIRGDLHICPACDGHPGLETDCPACDGKGWKSEAFDKALEHKRGVKAVST
jgi:DNA modification methylase